jgi:hypothetical protein
MGIMGGLPGDSRHHIRVAMPDIQRSNPSGEVQIHVAVHIGDLGAVTFGRIHVVVGIDSTGQIPLALGVQNL